MLEMIFIYMYILNSFSKWKGDSGSVHSICLCAQNHLLSSGRSIKLWDLETYSVLKVFQGGHFIDSLKLPYCSFFMRV